MAEYQAIIIGATIGLIGSILSATVIIGRIKPAIAVGLIGLILGAAAGGALARSLTLNDGQRKIQAPFDVSSHFYPTGWMGDAEYGANHVEFQQNHRTNTRVNDEDSSCIRICYKAGPKGWAGIYWQYPENNWGDFSGTNIVNARRITFWARGSADGGELVEFLAGNIRAPGKLYSDSFMSTSGQISLTRQWNRWEIDLEGKDLSCVLGAFAIIFPVQSNDNGLTIFVDDIRYE